MKIHFLVLLRPGRQLQSTLSVEEIKKSFLVTVDGLNVILIIEAVFIKDSPGVLFFVVLTETPTVENWELQEPTCQFLA